MRFTDIGQTSVSELSHSRIRRIRETSRHTRRQIASQTTMSNKYNPAIPYWEILGLYGYDRRTAMSGY